MLTRCLQKSGCRQLHLSKFYPKHLKIISSSKRCYAKIKIRNEEDFKKAIDNMMEMHREQTIKNSPLFKTLTDEQAMHILKQAHYVEDATDMFLKKAEGPIDRVGEREERALEKENYVKNMLRNFGIDPDKEEIDMKLDNKEKYDLHTRSELTTQQLELKKRHIRDKNLYEGDVFGINKHRKIQEPLDNFLFEREEESEQSLALDDDSFIVRLRDLVQRQRAMEEEEEVEPQPVDLSLTDMYEYENEYLEEDAEDYVEEHAEEKGHTDDPEKLPHILNRKDDDLYDRRKPTVNRLAEFEFLYDVTHDPDNDKTLFDEEFIKKLYDRIDGSAFESIDQFYESIKYAGDKQEVLSRINQLIPGLTPGEQEALLDRILEILRTKPGYQRKFKWHEKQISSGVERAIQRVTDSVTANTKPTIMSFHDLMALPPSKGVAVNEALERIYKGRVHGYQLLRACENASTMDIREFEDEDEYLYHILAPIHQEELPPLSDKKNINPYHPEIFKGVAHGVGKRKTAVARVWITPGTGIFTINGRPHLDYFAMKHDQAKILTPLALAGVISQFNITVKVHGGGTTGQSEAVRLGLARALTKFIPGIGRQFKKNGLLTRDTRVVERKKPGQPKARKKFQWVKR